MGLGYLRRFGSLGRNARLYLLSNTLQAVSAGALGVLYTLFLSALGYGTGFIGTVVAVGSIGAVLALLPAGPLVDRLGWRTMLLWSDVIGGLAIALQLLAPTRPIVLITTLGVGASLAIVLVINAPLLAANSTPHERTALFGLSTALGAVALVAGSLLGGALPQWFALAAMRDSGLLRLLHPYLVAGEPARDYQLALLAIGALTLPSIIPIILMREQRPLDQGAGEPTPVARPRRIGLRHAARGVRERLPGWLGAARRLASGPIGRFSASQALLGLGSGMLAPYINIYFVNHLHASTPLYGALSAALIIAQGLTALLSAPLADRYGKLRTVVLTQAASLPFLLALAVVSSLGTAAAIYLLQATLVNVGNAPLQAFYMEAVPERSRGLASEVYNGAVQGAAALGGIVAGGLLAATSYGVLFVLATLAFAISIVLLVRWFTPQRPNHMAALTASDQRLAPATHPGGHPTASGHPTSERAD